MVEGRRSHIKNDGKGATGRYENRQGFEANRWCNAGDGRKAPRVFEYNVIKTSPNSSGPLPVGSPSGVLSNKPYLDRSGRVTHLKYVPTNCVGI